MPRKAKVQAVPVEQADQTEGLVVAGDVEVKTEAEQLTDVINEVKAEVEEAVVPVVEPVVEPKTKAKPKAKAKAKAVPPPEVTPEPVVVLTQGPSDQREPPAPVIEEVAKASCPDCGKQMSAKTLKYSHKCTTAKVAPVVTSRIVEIVEDEVEKRFYNRRAERAARREAVVEKLMLSAF